MWKEISENYAVNEIGEVLNLKSNRLLKLNGVRYLKCALYYKNTPKFENVHRLVAQAFIPNPDNKPYVNHLNGVRTDNRVENLEWCDAKENTTHAIKTGLTGSKYETNYNSKLSNEDVIKIRSLIGTISNNEIAKMFGVNFRTISNIKNNKSWINL